MKKTVLAIGAGLPLKKFGHWYERAGTTPSGNYHFNYPLLGLCTKLSENGFDARLFQGFQEPVANIFDRIKSTGIDITKIETPILISIPSVYSIDWLNDFAEQFKSENPKTKIVAGGRYVIDPNENWIREKMPKIDLFVRGCADKVIDRVISPADWNTLNGIQVAKKPFSHFNYELLHDAIMFQPSIDLARGCPAKCDFCPEKNQGGVTCIKTPQEVIAETQRVAEFYNDDKLNFYLETPHFNPSAEWADEFAESYAKSNSHFKWRATGRVDAIQPTHVETLSHAGLKVLDLGLESGSREMLLKMNKTADPSQYLEKAATLMESSTRAGVWNKLNILTHPGETNKTLAETHEFLTKNRANFKGVSAGSFILYRQGDDMTKILDHVEKLSGVRPNTENLEQFGYTYVDLSKEIDQTAAKDACREISNKFMTPKDFRELKEVTYTARECGRSI